MKLIPITRVALGTKEFQHDCSLFVVQNCPRAKMTIWTLHSRFKGKAEYRALCDKKRVPIAIQRLRAA